jgi:hypothetical protein
MKFIYKHETYFSTNEEFSSFGYMKKERFINFMDILNKQLIDSNTTIIIPNESNIIPLDYLCNIIIYIITNDLFSELNIVPVLKDYLNSLDGYSYELEQDNHHKENRIFENLYNYYRFNDYYKEN